MEIQPASELVFKKINGSTSKEILAVTNTSDSKKIGFKVKTTAPKLFAVRPNFGVLRPGQKQEVFIAIQSRDGQPFEGQRKDKFLVQAIFIPDDQDIGEDNLSQLWEQAKQLKTAGGGAEAVMEKVLKCTYLTEGETSATAADAVSAQTSNFPEETEAKVSLPRKVATSETSEQNSLQLAKELNDAKEKVATLQAACEGYKLELERVNNLRQRKAETHVMASSASISRQQLKPVGLNIQVVAALCLLSFLLGILLF